MEKERFNLKLKLYGSYMKEIEMIENRYSEILQEKRMNDMPSKAARNLGYCNSDPYHTAVEKMQLEEASLLKEASEKEEEINYLGINDFLDSLSSNERLVIDEIFVRNNTYRGVAILVNSSKTSVHRLVNKIIEKGTRTT